MLDAGAQCDHSDRDQGSDTASQLAGMPESTKGEPGGDPPGIRKRFMQQVELDPGTTPKTVLAADAVCLSNATPVNAAPVIAGAEASGRTSTSPRRSSRRYSLRSIVKRVRWWAHPRRWLRTILNLQDNEHSIALGTAIGVFIGMTPTVGIQMVIVVVLALLTRRLIQFNRAAALLAVYISNPVTTLPIYWFDYEVGTMFLPRTVTREHFEQVFRSDSLGQCWILMGDLLLEVGTPLFLGSLLTGAVAAAIAYPTVLYCVRLVRSTADRAKSARAE